MKNRYNRILLSVLALSLVFASCKKCGDWEEKDGKDCVEMREKFIGMWVGEKMLGGPYPVADSLLIDEGANINEVTFNIGSGHTGTLTSSNSFLHTSSDSAGNYEVVGELINEELTVRLYFATINDPSTMGLVFTFTGTKK